MPAVGHKTASVVMSQAFGVPAFPVDTHIHRLMYRWGLTNGKSVEQTEKDAKALFPRESLEQASLANHFLRPGVQPRPRLVLGEGLHFRPYWARLAPQNPDANSA